MQIERIKYKEIDFNKYNACIADSTFPTIYAMSWYLDVVTARNWEILVYNDYQYVMPVPYARLKRNFMLKSVAQPMFCQQLGIFSASQSKEVYEAMLQKLRKERLSVYHLNEYISPFFPHLEKRNNYILQLNLPYEQIWAHYKKDRKKDVKRAQNKGWSVTHIDSVDIYIEALLTHASYLNAASRKTFTTLLSKCADKNTIIGKQLLNKEGQWMAMAIWLKSYDRRILISSIRHPQLGEREAGTVLRDAFIKEHAASNLIFDFEGSMIKGVASFNASFGAVAQPYPVLMR